MMHVWQWLKKLFPAEIYTKKVQYSLKKIINLKLVAFTRAILNMAEDSQHIYFQY